MFFSCRYNDVMHILPGRLYSTAAVSQVDKTAIEEFNIPGLTLMRRAGQAVFNFIENRFVSPATLLVVCGAGNNAGDGYVIARIADQRGWKVKVVSLVDMDDLQGDAKQAALHWCERGEVLEPVPGLLDETDIVIDAMLGTGIKRDVSGLWQQWINAINASDNYIVAVDVPSGLNANTGAIMGDAIRADVTVSFIGLKKGMFTASGKACCGEIIFDDLSVADEVFDKVSADAELMSDNSCVPLSPRRHDAHKGQNGHVLIIGGNAGMPGAVILAAKSALKTGAGLVTVLTKPEHVAAVVTSCPEVMVLGSVNGDIPETLIDKVHCLVIGPGLGRDAWAQRLLYQAMRSQISLVFDADALNMLAENQAFSQMDKQSPCVITPHPGEAARLLSTSSRDIQQDRFKAAIALHEKTAAIVVLKGSGTIVYDGEVTRVCPYGNPAMSVAGMGDVLSGVIAACFVQGLELKIAASTAVFYHSLAGDLAAGKHSRGLTASELIEKLPQVIN